MEVLLRNVCTFTFLTTKVSKSLENFQHTSCSHNNSILYNFIDHILFPLSVVLEVLEGHLHVLLPFGVVLEVGGGKVGVLVPPVQHPESKFFESRNSFFSNFFLI